MNVNVLLEKLNAHGRSQEERECIEKAYTFAARAHEGQKRKSGEPYITHPLAAAERLLDMRLDTATIAAALLHDVCEDTEYTIEDIKKNFGEEVAFLVEGVTKLGKIRYKGNERSAESLRKMFLAIAEDIRIVLLKLVDRLHNMETLRFVAREKQKRIALETLEIYAPLAYRLGIKEISGKLEDLAFPYVYTKEYHWLMRSTEEKYNDWDAYLKRFQPIVVQELEREGIPFIDVHSRAKRYYSLYQKLLKYDMDIAKITDLMALRVLVPTIDDCYQTLGVIHTKWRPLPGKIKDYIALPKPNGYRSIHTTVFGPEERLVEIQIRTKEMHNESEHGIAAHWAYSEFKRANSQSYAKKQTSFADGQRTAWIRQISEWQKDFEKSSDFLETLKIDFFKNRIFVMTPKGDVFDLPEGSTPLDLAYHIHTDIGNTAVGAKVNGRMVAFDYKLQNRDVVSIITSKSRKPSRAWLEFLRTSQARKKVLSSVRKIEEESRAHEKKQEMAEIRLVVQNRIGLLRDVTQTLARRKINVASVSTDTKNRALPLLVIQAPFKKRIELERIMIKIKEIRGVEDVSYRFL